MNSSGSRVYAADHGARYGSWVVSPLPKGDVRLVVEWGDEGVSGVQHLIPGQKLPDAAAMAVKLPRWETDG